MSAVAVGCSVPAQAAGLEDVRQALRSIADAGLDHVMVGDHVSFRGGRGVDGLIAATLYAALEPRLTTYLSVYLLPLRHPATVARQLATLATYAPGRLVLGVGVGGEDRHEVEICGVDPATRGRRMDECLVVLRGLLTGAPVTFQGEQIQVSEAQIVPPPRVPIPIVIGGRSDVAIRRAGRLGEGWLGIWCSTRRFAAAVELAAAEAEQAGRDAVAWQHGMQVWCGIGASREQAREQVAAAMEQMYRLPFASFERYVPYGTPADVADALRGYVEAGCRSFNLVPCAESSAEAIEGAGEIRRRLSRDRACAAEARATTNPRA
jgi:alkanesulfonate monooxygenase SsuD/methylene tetrahydromethanopterin reductase-like flavin-dependent oxidoreductase (luciferase family)